MKTAKIVYIALIALILIPFDKMGLPQVSAPIALLCGLIFAFIFPNPCPKFNKKTSEVPPPGCCGMSRFQHESAKSR